MLYFPQAVDIASGAVADTYKTILAMIAPNTAGYRFKLRELWCGFSDDTPADRNVSVVVKRILDAAGGTAGTATTITAANVAKADTDMLDFPFTAKRDYSAEPTAYAAENVFSIDLNTYGMLPKEWSFKDAPCFLKNQHCGILVAPRAAAASRITVHAAVEWY